MLPSAEVSQVNVTICHENFIPSLGHGNREIYLLRIGQSSEIDLLYSDLQCHLKIHLNLALSFKESQVDWRHAKRVSAGWQMSHFISCGKIKQHFGRTVCLNCWSLFKVKHVFQWIKRICPWSLPEWRIHVKVQAWTICSKALILFERGTKPAQVKIFIDWWEVIRSAWGSCLCYLYWSIILSPGAPHASWSAVHPQNYVVLPTHLTFIRRLQTWARDRFHDKAHKVPNSGLLGPG